MPPGMSAANRTAAVNVKACGTPRINIMMPANKAWTRAVKPTLMNTLRVISVRSYMMRSAVARGTGTVRR